MTQTSANTGKMDLPYVGALNTSHRSRFSPLIMVLERTLKLGLVLKCFAWLTNADTMSPCPLL